MRGRSLLGFRGPPPITMVTGGSFCGRTIASQEDRPEARRPAGGRIGRWDLHRIVESIGQTPGCSHRIVDSIGRGRIQGNPLSVSPAVRYAEGRSPRKRIGPKLDDRPGDLFRDGICTGSWIRSGKPHNSAPDRGFDRAARTGSRKDRAGGFK